jgi:hypothetical protein
MHAVNRRTAAVGFAIALVATLAGPAAADRRADTTCAGDGCEATAENHEPAHYGAHSKTPSPVTCRYKNMGIDPNATMLRPDGSAITADGTGQWFERQCVDARDLARINDAAGPNPDEITHVFSIMEQLQAVQRQPVYIRTRQVPELIDEARSRLQFPILTPRFSPSSPWTFVNFPTSLWLDGDSSPNSSAAEVPGVRVTVTATLEQVRWETGDGATEVCAGPGHAPTPNTQSGDSECSHRWSWPSTGQPGDAYEVTATAMWSVSWTAEGAPGGGDLGLIPQRSQPIPVPVAEIQMLNTPTDR